MKKIFIFSMLISLALICSCGKQDSTAEQQLAQRKVELDTRENALAERESALDAREKALAVREKALTEREKAIANMQKIPDNPSESKAETDSRVQQLPPGLRGLVPDSSRAASAKAEKDTATQERLAQRQRSLEQLQSQRQHKFEAMQKWQSSGGAVSPAA
ncbi:MAG: hypothetical protein DME90_07735, partial [Verrucomicrobia bacterium]